VVDALAARRFQRIMDGWRELRVGLDGAQLVWLASEADAADQSVLEEIETGFGRPLPAGYCTELQPGLSAWLGNISQSLERGLVLLVDYGYPRSEYYHPQRSSGTLICHYRHHAHDDPFLWPGLQDISVNVEFTALAEAMDDAGLAVLGYTSQAEFLMASGLQDILGESIEWPDNKRLALQQEVVKLSSPAVMGERFKVIAAGRGLDQAPMGFSIANHLQRL
jgi:SAM-dependent MidA family methyltransferase